MGGDLHLVVLGLSESKLRIGEGFDACVSISDPPGDSRPVDLDAHIKRVLRLTFDDNENSRGAEWGEEDAPVRAHAETLVAFLREGLAAGCERWLIHCHAGISRSAASALVLLGLKYGFDDPSLASRLFKIRRRSMPNRLFVALCEDVLGLSHRPLLKQAESLQSDCAPFDVRTMGVR